jgi:signal recognition particle receptor subunit beta
VASINYATREISCKIVYYGPGLSGKTTNLQIIHRKIPDKDKSEMVSLATETDRTLFFDFLPLDLGSIKGFSTKFQLYTVPGQVYYNATRKLVLRGVDGVVFVVDSQVDKLQENLESFANLQENLREYGHSIENIPMVLQFNKRDLPNVYPLDQLNSLVNKHGLPYYEAVAATGVGVFTTLKAIGKSVIDKFNAKYAGFQGSGGRRPARPGEAPAPQAQPPAPAQGYTPPAPARDPLRTPPSANPGSFQGGFAPPQGQPPQFQPPGGFRPGAPAGGPVGGGFPGNPGSFNPQQNFPTGPSGAQHGGASQGGAPQGGAPQGGGFPGAPGGNPFAPQGPQGGQPLPFANPAGSGGLSKPGFPPAFQGGPAGQGAGNPGAPQFPFSGPKQPGPIQPPMPNQGFTPPGNIPVSPFVEGFGAPKPGFGNPPAQPPQFGGQQSPQGNPFGGSAGQAPGQPGFKPFPPAGGFGSPIPPAAPGGFTGFPSPPAPGHSNQGFTNPGFGQAPAQPGSQFGQPKQPGPAFPAPPGGPAGPAPGQPQFPAPPQGQGGQPPGRFQGPDDNSGIVSTYEDSANENFKTRKLPHPKDGKKGFFDGLFKKEK